MRANHTLIVMRHAKAGELAGGPDFDRPLRPRGKRDSAAAGRWLAAHGYRVDLVVCSSAVRTLQTWKHASPELGGKPKFSAERRLYQADSEDVVQVIRESGEQVPTVMYIGHNPAAAELVGEVTGSVAELPTAAIAVIDLAGDWASLAPGTGELTALWTPKMSE